MDDLLLDRLQAGEPHAADALVDRFLRQLTRHPQEAKDLAGRTLLLRIEWGHGATRPVTEFQYPNSVAPGRLGVPPLGWSWPDDLKHLDFPDPRPLPRFDLDRERAEIDRLTAVGLRTATVKRRKMKLVGAFQEMGNRGATASTPRRRAASAHRGASRR